jgi:tRNA threonylcarbamoyladenosine biosynthesis protein TsaB
VSDGAVIGEFFVNNKLTHSETLMKMVEDLFSVTKCNISEVTAVAVTTGPGSFTGLRIGIAAVKGLSFGSDKMCIPVSSLLSVAYNFLGEEKTVAVCFDARLSQVYNAIFKVSADGVERLCEDRAISISDLVKELKNYDNVVLAGDGAELVYGEFPESQLAPENKRYQKASSLCFAALKNLKKGVSAESLVPTYLRLPQAERLRKEGLK